MAAPQCSWGESARAAGSSPTAGGATTPFTEEQAEARREEHAQLACAMQLLKELTYAEWRPMDLEGDTPAAWKLRRMR